MAQKIRLTPGLELRAITFSQVTILTRTDLGRNSSTEFGMRRYSELHAATTIGLMCRDISAYLVNTVLGDFFSFLGEIIFYFPLPGL